LIYGGYLWGFFSATFLIPLYGGLFWKKATKEGAIASFIIGFITIISFMAININSNMHPAFFSVITSGISFYLVSMHFYNKKGIHNEN
ncbi:MAG: hypothetical protein K0Q97_1948, partial [Bacillota bacterium]|nr:hypothetical protein [Bacillota bacterium]